MNTKRMNVLFQCDDRYAAVTGVSMTSLLENNCGAEDIHLYLINDHVSSENREKFTLLARRYGRTIEFLDMHGISQRLAADGAPKWSGSYAAYGRLFAPGLIGEEIDRLLYLDSDTIVTAELDELYSMELEGAICAMAQDTLSYALYRHLGHRRDELYFNSGVILFDVMEWKRQGCEAAVFPFLSARGSQLHFPDQDTLNTLLKGKIKRLDAKYNFFVQFLTLGIEENYYVYSLDKKPHYYSREEMAQAGRDAVIYHFSTGEKPWVQDARCALADRWEDYLRLSPWAGMAQTERKEQPIMTRVQGAINLHTGPVIRKMAHKLYVCAFVPAESRIRSRRASG